MRTYNIGVAYENLTKTFKTDMIKHVKAYDIKIFLKAKTFLKDGRTEMKRFNQAIDNMNESWVGIYYRGLLIIMCIVISFSLPSFPFEMHWIWKWLLFGTIYGSGLIAVYSFIRLFHQKRS